MKDTALYLNIPEPKVSQFGEASQLQAIRPTTEQVTSAFVEEMFQGEGSLSQDIKASNIEAQERRGKPIQQNEWKASSHYREGINWYDGLTSESAATLARIEDDRQERSLIMERATDLQTGIGMGVGFATGIFEPKNFASGVAAALVTGGAGSIIPSFGRLIATQTVKGAAVRGAIEGGVAAAIVEPSNLESSKIVQGDYTMADTLLNFGLSSVLGAGIGAGLKKIELKSAGKVSVYEPENADLAIKEFDTALAQTVQGQAVDVSAVKQVDNAEVRARAQRELPKIEEQIAKKQQETGITKVTELPEFKTWFEGSKVVDDTGAPMVVYHGTNADFEAFDIKKIGESGTAHGYGFYFTNNIDVAKGYRKEGSGKVIPVYMVIKKPLLSDAKNFSVDELQRIINEATDIEIERYSDEIDDYKSSSLSNYVDTHSNSREASVKSVAKTVFESSEKAVDQIKELSNIFGDKVIIPQSVRKVTGYDGIYVKDFEGKKGSDLYISWFPEQMKSVFNRGKFDPNDPRLIEAERLEVKRGQALTDANRQIDQAPIKSLQEQLAKPDNSTAYAPDADVKVQKELDEYGDIDDQIRLERDLEGLQEELEILREQGVLSGEDVRVLDKLREIDQETNIWDNILANAQICLTRG